MTPELCAFLLRRIKMRKALTEQENAAIDMAVEFLQDHVGMSLEEAEEEVWV